MKKLTIFLSATFCAAGMFGNYSSATAAIAFWAEEANFLPNQDPAHPNRWGQCTGVAGPGYDACNGGKFGGAAGMIAAMQMSTIPGEPNSSAWVLPTNIDTGVEGIGVLDGALAPNRPSPLANLTEYTVEARFKATLGPGQTLGSLAGSGNWAFAIGSRSTGNINWSYRYGWDETTGLQANWLGDEGHVFTNASTPLVDFDQNWHVVRIAQKFDESDPNNGFIDMWIDGTLILSNEDNLHTFEQTDFGNNYRNEINRTFNVGGNSGGKAGWALDYIRMANSIVPISEAILAPGGPTFDAADFDQDGDVDTADYNAWRSNFGTANGATKGQGDSNADGDVDGGDFLAWQAEYGNGGGSISAVPEPAALAMLLLGSTLATVRRRLTTR